MHRCTRPPRRRYQGHCLRLGKTVRDSKNIGFISLSDGSCYKPVQIVFQADKLANYAEIAKCGLYTSFEVTGTLVVTPGASSPLRSTPTRSRCLAPAAVIIRCRKKNGHGLPAHHDPPAPRTNTFNAAFRVRGQAAFALHQFFHEHGFTYVHTPILPALTARAPVRCSRSRPSTSTTSPQRRGRR